MRRDDPRPSTVRSSLTVAGVLAGFVVVMAISALQGQPVFRPLAFSLPEISRTPEPEPSGESSLLPELKPPSENPVLRIIATVLAVVIISVILFLLARFLIRLVLRLWAERPLRHRDGAEIAVGAATATTAEPGVDAPIVREGIAGALDAITRNPRPGDAIVAAWVGLEQAASRAGQNRAASETAAEFTTRIVGRRDGVAAEVVALLALYESVRFGGHAATEQDRGRARDLLQRIEQVWR